MPDEWFSSFVQLGCNLARFSKLDSLKLNRVLITVPRKEYVSIAIAYGYSMRKLTERKFSGREINFKSLETLPPGAKLRIYFATGFIDSSFVRFEGNRSRIVFDTGEQIRTNKVEGVIKRIYLLPDGHPLGDHKNLEDLTGDINSASENELWRTQSDPGLLVFTDQQYYEEQISGVIKNLELEKITGKQILSIQESIRTGNFLKHNSPAFINAYSRIFDFENCLTEEKDRFNLMNWIVLDGNNSITKLASREELIEKKVLSILEMGVPRSQGKALESFTAELNRFNKMNVCKALVWNPPPGVNIWGWSR